MVQSRLCHSATQTPLYDLSCCTIDSATLCSQTLNMWQILPISIRYISGSIVSSITLKIEHNLGSGHQLRGGGRLKTGEGGGREAHEVLPLLKKGGGEL